MSWYFLAITSALLSASSAILEKKILTRADVLPLVTLSAALNLVFTLPLVAAPQAQSLNAAALFVVATKSVLYAFSYFFIMQAIKRLEISSALPLLVTTPAFVLLFEVLIWHQHVSLFQVVGVALILSGTYVLQASPKKGIFSPFTVFAKSKGYQFIFVTILLLVAASLLDKYVLSSLKVRADAFLWLQHIFIFAVYVLMSFAGKVKFERISSTLKQNLWLIVFLSAFTVAYRYSQFLAIQVASVGLVLSIKRISVFIAAMVGGKLFKEGHLLRKAVATAMMLAGASLVIMK